MAALSMRLIGALLVMLLAASFSVIMYMRNDVVVVVDGGDDDESSATSSVSRSDHDHRGSSPAGRGGGGHEGGADLDLGEGEGARIDDRAAEREEKKAEEEEEEEDEDRGKTSSSSTRTASVEERGDGEEEEKKPPRATGGVADAGDSVCDLRHWVHGVFDKDVFVPTHITPVPSMNPPKVIKDALNQKFHWFTKKEAEQCLRHKRVWVIGDSYMRNQYIGLMDVIRGNKKNPNEAITQGVPEKPVKIPFLPKHFGDVGQATIKGANITATFIGGRRFGLGLYIDDIKALLTHIKDDDLVVFNALIHDNKRNRVISPQFKGDMKKAENYYVSLVEDLAKWLAEQKPKGKFIWSTSTSYKEKKVPLQFRKYQMNKRILAINNRAAEIWKKNGFPVSDVFHLTLACQANSCTKDGSHHNRMVNRAKAHVVLNHFCRPESCDMDN